MMSAAPSTSGLIDVSVNALIAFADTLFMTAYHAADCADVVALNAGTLIRTLPVEYDRIAIAMIATPVTMIDWIMSMLCDLPFYCILW